MSQMDMLDAEALRVLKRIKSIPPNPLRNNAKHNKKGIFVDQALAEGNTALGNLKMEQDAIDESTLMIAQKMSSTVGMRPKLRENEQHSEKLAQLKSFAKDQAAKIDDLIDLAVESLNNASPVLTGIRYGAALLTRGGYVFTGCNIESNETALNTSAEKMAILKALSAGKTEFDCIVLTWDQSETDRFPLPSGASRQYLAEFGDFDVVVVKCDPVRSRKEFTTYELLPHIAQMGNSQPNIHVKNRSHSCKSPKNRNESPATNTSRNEMRHVLDKTTVRDWGVRHVLLWLDEICDLPSYQHNFQESSVNGAMLLQLTTQDLEEIIGVYHPLHLSKLQRGIAKLKKREVVEYGAETNEMGDLVDSLKKNEIVLVARLKDAFDQIDKSIKGQLDANQLKSVLHLLGFEISSEQIHEWIQKYGEEDSTLTFPQFVHAFFIMSSAYSVDDDADEMNKNHRLLVSKGGHVQCRTNKNYSEWLEAQQTRQGLQKIGADQSLRSPSGDTSKSQLALWVKGEESNSSNTSIRRFLNRNRTPKAAGMTQQVRAEDFARLKRLFDRADRDNAGELTRHEAARAISKTGMKVSPVEFGQYLRLQQLDSSCPIDIFEFARAFAYFLKQKEVKIDNLSRDTSETPSNAIILGESRERFPAAYDPNGLLASLDRKNRKRLKWWRKSSSKKKKKSSKSTKRRGRSRRRRYESSSSSSSCSDSDGTFSSNSDSSDDSESTASMSASTSSSGSSSSSGSESGNSSASDSGDSSLSSSYRSSASSSSSSEEDEPHKKSKRKKRKKRKQSKVKRKTMVPAVTKKVEKAFQKSQKRGQIAVNAIYGALISIPRSKKSKSIPSKTVLAEYFQANNIKYYVSRKQFLQLYSVLCYDNSDKTFRKTRSTSKGASSSDGEGNKWRVGDAVQSRFKGKLKWFNGEITKVHTAEGTYDILYDDGDIEKRVRASLIRSPLRESAERSENSDYTSDEEGKFFKGERVEVRSGGRWSRARVSRVNEDSTVDVHFENGDLKRRVPVKNLRRARKMDASSGTDDSEDVDFSVGDTVQARYKGGKKLYKGVITKVNHDGTFAIDYDDGDRERRVKKENMVPMNKKTKSKRFTPGDLVEGKFKGGRKWYKGKIKRVNRDGTVDVVYDDGDQERGMDVEKVRKCQSSSRSRSPGMNHKQEIEVGDKVEAKYKGGRKYYKGSITKQNADGTYDITYNDGDRERRVSPSNINILESKRGRSRSRSRKPNLSRGMRVEAKFKNGTKWYKGKITREHADGTYDISYDDGDSERHVPEKNIRSMEDETSSDNLEEFRLGDKVEAKFKGGSKWYKGVITRINRNGSYDIDYNDGDSERSVQGQNIRKLGRTSSAKARSSRSPRSRRSAEPSESESDMELGKGDRVEAKYKNGTKWYKGEITHVHVDGSFDISYDDGDRERRVKPKLVKPLAGSKSKKSSKQKLEEGTWVEAKYKGGSKWYKGKITRKNFDETFDVTYNDGDRERGVLRKNIRALGLDETTTATSDVEFSKGDKVEALYKGGSKWYKGKIRAVNANGSCDIDYDDGDRERRVPAKNIRSFRRLTKSRSPRGRSRSLSRSPKRKDESSSEGEGFQAGDRVEAKYKGGSKWYKGKISRVNSDGSCDIDYDDGDRERRVPARNIKALRKSKETSKLKQGDWVEAKYKSGSKWYRGKIARNNNDGTFDITYDDGDRERRVVERNIRKIDSSDDSQEDSSFREGDSIEAKYKGGSKWYKGTVARVNRDGSCDIDYDDGDNERRVSARSIRKSGVSRPRNQRNSRSPVKTSPRRRTNSHSDDELAEDFDVGDSVQAKYKGGSKYYTGKITRKNRNGSYDIKYDDGDKEQSVPASRIKRVESSTTDDPGFQKGTRVEAKYKGGRKWYSGVIARVNRDGTCDVKYDDGDSEYGVSNKSIRQIDSTEASSGDDFVKMRIGDKVTAKFKGGTKWYSGKISRVNRDGTYDINYDDGDRESGVPSQKIRLQQGSGLKSRSRSPTRGQALDDETSDDAGLAKGDNVEARYKGGRKFYKGIIAKVNKNGTYNIDYEDGDKEQGLARRDIKKLERGGRGHDSSENEIEIGAKVEAKFKGGTKWYKGKVTSVNRDGSFDIAYDDGDRERRVPARNVRLCLRATSPRRPSNSPRRRTFDDSTEETTEAESFSRGDRVEARFKGKTKWYKGKVSRVNRDGTYDISYDDGDSDKGLHQQHVRSITNGRPGSGSRTTYSRNSPTSGGVKRRSLSPPSSSPRKMRSRYNEF